jgi:signal-transduction protein with cAMP-binding, CBS, and nucleotidyltransferase domain
MSSTQTVKEVMTLMPRTLDVNASVTSAAQFMAEAHLGAVIVTKGESIRGILTDRDIVLRCVAKGSDCDDTTVGSVCSDHLATLSPRDTVDNAIALMASKAIRRIPVVDDGRTVGILSLGDLAQNRDPNSALGDISAAAPNN